MKAPFRLVLLLFAVSTILLQAQGTKTRDDAAKYSTHAQVGSLGLGADFWGHYIPMESSSIKADEYLVVEVALFAPPAARVAIHPGQFVLSVNGQRLMPQPVGLVTLGIVMPDMRDRGPRLITDTTVGPITASTGRDPVQPKFPGDSNPADIPVPTPPKPDDGLQKEPVDLVKLVRDAALPEGTHGTPISGYLFYAWPGKLKRIKHVEVEYTSSLGTAMLTLR
jgi:hypothetical protein